MSHLSVDESSAVMHYGETRGRRMEVGWEIELGTVPTVQYLIGVYR